MQRGHRNIHERLTGREPPSGSTDRGFGIVFAAVFALAGGWSLYKGGGWWPGLFVAAALMLGMALWAPALLAPFNRIWTAFGLLLHTVINPVVMALIFVAAVMPTALVMRLFGLGSLELGFDGSARSYWRSREQTALPPESFRRQF